MKPLEKIINKIIARAELDMLERTLAIVQNREEVLTCIIMEKQAQHHAILGTAIAAKYRRQMREVLQWETVERLFCGSPETDWERVSARALAWRIGYLTKKIELAKEVLGMNK